MDRMIIIAGGPSVVKINPEDLTKHGFVLGVNDSYLRMNCHQGITMDRLWMENRIGVVKAYNKPFWARYPAIKNLSLTPEDTFIKPYICEETNVLSSEENHLNGTNSGMCALNLAYHNKPKLLYLFGFDMKETTKVPYWYPQYPWVKKTKNKKKKYVDWCNQMIPVAKQLESVGIKVKNVTIDSNLVCFEKITYKEYLKEVKNNVI